MAAATSADKYFLHVGGWPGLGVGVGWWQGWVLWWRRATAAVARGGRPAARLPTPPLPLPTLSTLPNPTCQPHPHAHHPNPPLQSLAWTRRSWWLSLCWWTRCSMTRAANDRGRRPGGPLPRPSAARRRRRVGGRLAPAAPRCSRGVRLLGAILTGWPQRNGPLTGQGPPRPGLLWGRGRGAGAAGRRPRARRARARAHTSRGAPPPPIPRAAARPAACFVHPIVTSNHGATGGGPAARGGVGCSCRGGPPPAPACGAPPRAAQGQGESPGAPRGPAVRHAPRAAAPHTAPRATRARAPCSAPPCPTPRRPTRAPRSPHGRPSMAAATPTTWRCAARAGGARRRRGAARHDRAAAGRRHAARGARAPGGPATRHLPAAASHPAPTTCPP
jgi:hypothetical protein